MHFCCKCGAATPIPERKRASGRGPTSASHCRACLDARSAAQVRRVQLRAAKGQCGRCGVALVNFNFLECARCRSRTRRWWALRQGKAVIPELLPHRPTGKRPPAKAAGLKRQQINAVADEPAAGLADRPLADRPERSCSNCGRSFAPTERRRMLCEGCYTRGHPRSADYKPRPRRGGGGDAAA